MLLLLSGDGVSLRDRLPRVNVPLGGDRPDVVLDLQEAFNNAYNGGAFDRTIEYDQSLTPALPAEDAAWAESLLRPAA